MTRIGGGRAKGFSAGSQPVGQVNPFALSLLRDEGFDVSDLSSKSWDVFAGESAPSMDFIFTVCGSAAAEICPIWPGHPATAHWGLDDPAAVQGGEEESMAAFRTAYEILRRRVEAFAVLDLDTVDRATLKHRLDEIGVL